LVKKEALKRSKESKQASSSLVKGLRFEARFTWRTKHQSYGGGARRWQQQEPGSRAKPRRPSVENRQRVSSPKMGPSNGRRTADGEDQGQAPHVGRLEFAMEGDIGN
uniref:Reverse transcriptase domain-containing protein n=1 Tax=Echinostoma caproni TaxID=27848 RepID=A0A183A4L4_9TREM